MKLVAALRNLRCYVTKKRNGYIATCVDFGVYTVCDTRPGAITALADIVESIIECEKHSNGVIDKMMQTKGTLPLVIKYHLFRLRDLFRVVGHYKSFTLCYLPTLLDKGNVTE